MPSIFGHSCSGCPRARSSTRNWAGPIRQRSTSVTVASRRASPMRSGGGGDEDNRMSRGSKSTTKSVRPGIMPVLFGRHQIDKAVFLSLNEVADNLPPLEEECIPLRMDEELARVYREDVETPLADAIKVMIRRGDRRLL